jgi:hypothetical protein
MTRRLQDITRITPDRAATARRLLDLRQPLIPALSPKRPARPEPAMSAQRVAAEANSTPQSGVGTDTVPTEETDRVRRQGVELAAASKSAAPQLEAARPAAPATPAPQSWRNFGRWPWRTLLIRSLKLGAFLGLSYIALSLTIELPTRLIAVYAAAALLYAIDSQRTILIALIFLALAPVWSALGRTTDAQNYAVYAFYFLVLGLVCAARETLVKPTDGHR